MGAIVQPHSVTLLTTYCTRGSLADVLANDDLRLDQMFVASLVADILKAIIYLHDSVVNSHGNIHSRNCLVDSRWVCQIGDFGLHGFRNVGIADATCAAKISSRKRSLLWRSPELLRSPSAAACGTQKGDIYSFGIVLYEIVGRNGPWGETQLTPEGNSHRVLKSIHPTNFLPNSSIQKSSIVLCATRRQQSHSVPTLATSVWPTICETHCTPAGPNSRTLVRMAERCDNG